MCLRVLGQGVAAQKVEGHSAFKMYLVTTSSRKPLALPHPPLAPFLLCGTHSVSLEGRDPVVFCPPSAKSQSSVWHFVKHVAVFTELGDSERSISSVSKQT